MKKKKQITALLAAAAMVFSINSGAIAAEPDIAVEENSRSIGLSCSDMFDMPGPNGQQCIGYLVTNNYTMDLGVGLTIESRDENYENIGSASAFIPCLASGETEFISVVNCYEDTAEYIYSKWSTCTAVDTTSEPSSISCSDMYTLSGPNGQQCIGYEIINECTLDYFVGLTIEFLDESYGLIGTSSAHIPCLGSGGSTFIYVTNDYGTEAPYVRCSWSVALTVEESAVDDILVNVQG